jgi:hypothetical protein
MSPRNFTLITPVAMLVFNRPEETSRVFAAIREARPRQLLVIADGPRTERPDDFQKCAEVRRIVEQVDWPCEVFRNYSDINLGCKHRPISGFNWVFDLVEEAIILEDDCLPDPTFFRFCQELLQFYRDDERVMMICGTNLLGRWKDDQLLSYHFTHYDWVWGWASWRRAWRHNDANISLWCLQETRDKINNILKSEKYYKLRAMTFEQAYRNKIVAWDYQWACSRLIQGGLAIIPSVNLVSNIGYGAEATHTKVHDVELAELPQLQLTFPLTHQENFAADMDFDMAVVNMIRRKNTLFSRVLRFCRLLKMLIFSRNYNQSAGALSCRKGKDAT